MRKGAISPFLTMFSTLYCTYFPFQMHAQMSSAVCFNLDQPKILLSGSGLKHGKGHQKEQDRCDN